MLDRPGQTDDDDADEEESKIEVAAKPDFMDMWREPKLRQNLLGCILLWSMCSFNFYMLTFFMKYFPGNIFENSLCFAFSDLVAFTVSGLVIRYSSVVSGYRLAFLISSIGGVFYMLFSNIPVLIPVFLCMSRMGVTMAFNMGYISVPRLFPTKFQSTVYAVVNLFAHIIACFAPLVAEVPPPVPFIAYLAAIVISIFAL